jgi:hypothetical protein
VTALAAGAQSENLAEGIFQYVSGPSAIVVYAVADAALVKLEVVLGNVVEVNDYDLPVKAALAGPDRQSDMAARGVATPGDLVTVKLRNAGAAATNARVLIDILPI